MKTGTNKSNFYFKITECNLTLFNNQIFTESGHFNMSLNVLLRLKLARHPESASPAHPLMTSCLCLLVLKCIHICSHLSSASHGNSCTLLVVIGHWNCMTFTLTPEVHSRSSLTLFVRSYMISDLYATVIMHLNLTISKI